MPIIIDSHQDLAFNALTYGRDYLRSVADNRKLEENTGIPESTGYISLGWPEYQTAQVAVIIATIFTSAKRYHDDSTWDSQVYASPEEAERLYHQQIDFYRRLCDENPHQFRLIKTRRDLREVLSHWQKTPASYPEVTHPVGLVLSMEGAEGMADPRHLEEYHALGLRLVGPVWGGFRLCGSGFEPGGFTKEGYEFIEVMAELGYSLDIAHMSEKSALEALDRFQGPILCSHANARALLKNPPNERHLTDLSIRRLIERDGVMGVMPCNNFLLPGWKSGDDRNLVTLETLVRHIDHICQMAGDAKHVGIGSDFDGGFGWPAIPLELNSIVDLPKLGVTLTEHGYREADQEAIFGGNWRNFLERNLPD